MMSERVWVFTNEIPDGNWGGMGQVFRLPDIAALVGGDRAREAATKHLVERRRQSAQGLLDAAKEPAAV